MESKKAFELLLEVKDVCMKLNVKWWVDLGALLGFVRNGDFISWDPDIDLGTFDRDMWPQMAKKFKKRGYGIGTEYHPFPPKSERGGKLYKDRIHIGFCIRDKMNDLMWSTTVPWSDSDWFIVAIPLHYYEPLDRIIIKGYEFPIPNKVEEYLELLYGKNWRVPDKNWSIPKMPCVEKLEKLSIKGVNEAIEKWQKKNLLSQFKIGNGQLI